MAKGKTIRAEDIRDRETLEAWLKGRPREDAMAIAHRAALRVFPLYAAHMNTNWARRHELIALPVLRCHLLLAIANLVPTAEIKIGASILDARSAADAALSPARAAADAALTLGAVADANAILAAADAAVDAATDASAIWEQVSEDAGGIEAGATPLTKPLWMGDPPDRIRQAEHDMLALWDAEPPARWDFWRRWWEGAQQGRYLNPQLQLAIVEGVDNATWGVGPDAVAARIREIEDAFKAEPNSPDTLDKAIDRLPPATTDTVGTVRQAMIAHRQELPPTFDSILGYITLEIERLQGKNDGVEEARRQIGVLSTLHEAIQRLQALVPSSDNMPEEDAQEAEKLTRLIFRRFQEWPRAKPGEAEDNIADIADSSIRGALIGACAYMAPMVGTSPDKALIAGAVIFGGKKLLDTAKAAKDLVGGKVDK